MKNTIALGQCYEKDDVIYEVVGTIVGLLPLDRVILRHVITKKEDWFYMNEVLTWRRPFNTEG